MTTETTSPVADFAIELGKTYAKTTATFAGVLTALVLVSTASSAIKDRVEIRKAKKNQTETV